MTAQANSLAQQWLKDRKRLASANRALVLRAAAPKRFPQLFDSGCSAKEAEQVESYFTPLAKTYTGLNKTLAQSLESVRICAHYRDTQHASLQSYLNQF